MKQFKAFSPNTKASILIFLCILAVYGLSFYKRHTGYSYMMENADQYVVENVTAFSTWDSYYWVKVAMDLDAGKIGKGLRDPLKGYPDLEDYPEEPRLLSRLISLGKSFTGGNYYSGSLILIPLFAGLFVFPLFVYFNTLGFGASSVLGGLLGSFSFAYYSRSAMGLVDTDLLNLFFPMAVSAMIVLINQHRTFRNNLLLGIGAGLFMYLFNWWYNRPGFILVYLLILCIYLSLLRVPRKQTAWILLAFALASGPGYLWESIGSLQHFLGAYISPKATGQIVWPNILETIRETQTKDIMTKLTGLHGFLPIVFAGLAGLLWLYVIRIRQMVPITPVVIIGLWSLFGPSRFTMYLAPFIGIGLGILIELLMQVAGRKLSWRLLVITTSSIGLMLVIFFSTISYSAYNDTYGPVVPVTAIKDFLEIKRRVPPHSAMLSWWDNGYPLMTVGEFATYHDNGTHGGIRSTLIAKAITSPRQEDLAAMLSCVEEYGFTRLSSLSVAKNLSGDQLMSLVFNHPINLEKDNVYILYSEDMIKTFGSISMIGTWDFNTKTSRSLGYVPLPYFSRAGNIIHFRGGRIDLDRGRVIDDTTVVPLLAAVFVKDGYMIDRINYTADKGVYLQVLVTKNRFPELQLLEEPTYRSNFNQQFILGNYDRRFFEEVYNNVPLTRLFRVKSTKRP